MEVYFRAWEVPGAGERDLQIGDPETVQADGHGWNGQERAKGIIIRWPDDTFTTEQWNALTERQEVDRIVEPDGTPEPVTLRQRQYRLDIDKVSPERLAELLANDPAKPVITDNEFNIRDILDKEHLVGRSRQGDTLLSGRL